MTYSELHLGIESPVQRNEYVNAAPQLGDAVSRVWTETVPGAVRCGAIHLVEPATAVCTYVKLVHHLSERSARPVWEVVIWSQQPYIPARAQLSRYRKSGWRLVHRPDMCIAYSRVPDVSSMRSMFELAPEDHGFKIYVLASDVEALVDAMSEYVIRHCLDLWKVALDPQTVIAIVQHSAGLVYEARNERGELGMFFVGDCPLVETDLLAWFPGSHVVSGSQAGTIWVR